MRVLPVGWMLTAAALLRDTPKPTDAQIRQAEQRKHKGPFSEVPLILGRYRHALAGWLLPPGPTYSADNGVIVESCG